MNRELIVVIAASVIAVLAGAVLYRYTLYEPQIISARPGSDPREDSIRFDQLVLNDLQDRPRFISEWEKPLLVLNFWAPWCAPCRREIPDLLALQQAYPEQVQLLGLSFDSKQNVIDFVQDYDFNYPLLLVQNEASQLNRFFGNEGSGLPFTVVLNNDRQIVYRHRGEISRKELESQLKPLL